jgi:hypothetical protein
MTTTPTPVTDNLNVASPLLLSTTLVQVTSTLKITTNDNPYIDAEDGATNNRFTVGRDGSSQQVNVDFASNPTGSTTAVGAIRTYRDGVNLSEAMTFIENGNIGIGTNAPSGLLHVDGGSAIPRMILDADTNVARIFSFRTNNLPRWAFRVDGTESGTNTGSDLAIRRYDDTGAVIDAAMFISRATGYVGIGTATPATKLDVNGGAIVRGSASGFTGGELLLNAGNNQQVALSTNGTGSCEMYFDQRGTSTPLWKWRDLTDTRMTLTSVGLGIGTTTPASTLDVNGVVRVASYIEGSNFPYSLTSGSGADATITTLRGGSTAGQACSVVVSGGGAATNPNSIIFNVASAERGRFTTNGLTFNGDTAAANALDDYEEGTWTMGVSFGGGTTGVTYGVNTGTYTKIGRQVTVNGYLTLTSKGSSSGAASITGLPFTVGNDASFYAPISLWCDQITYVGQLCGYPFVGGTTILIEQFTELGNLSPSSNLNFANTSRMMISMTYFV